MELRHLRYFVSVAEMSSVGVTIAVKNSIVLPKLSRMFTISLASMTGKF